MTRSLRILYIDDNALCRKSMSALFACLGHQVELAPDGETGVQLQSGSHFDVIVTDYNMKGMNGVDVAMVVGVPTIVVSGLPAMDIPGLDNANIFGFLAKPFSLADMAHALDQVVCSGIRV